MADSFRHQAIVLTGASEGIGRELALQLAGEGAWLALASRNAERLGQVAKECAVRGGRAIGLPTDVGEPAACRMLVEAAVKTFGRLDMLINNAGISMYARLTDIQHPEMLEHILRVNFHGAINCATYALPALKESKGRIVAVSSLAGRIIAPGATAYAASKAALGVFFDALRAEVKSDQVSVTVAYPSFVRTDIYKRFLDADGNFGPDQSWRIPNWTMMSVERCARRILKAARSRRREVPPTLFDRLVLFLNRCAPGLVERFWQQTLIKDFPAATAPSLAKNLSLSPVVEQKLLQP